MSSSSSLKRFWLLASCWSATDNSTVWLCDYERTQVSDKIVWQGLCIPFCPPRLAFCVPSSAETGHHGENILRFGHLMTLMVLMTWMTPITLLSGKSMLKKTPETFLGSFSDTKEIFSITTSDVGDCSLWAQVVDLEVMGRFLLFRLLFSVAVFSSDPGWW